MNVTFQYCRTHLFWQGPPWNSIMGPLRRFRSPLDTIALVLTVIVQAYFCPEVVLKRKLCKNKKKTKMENLRRIYYQFIIRIRNLGSTFIPGSGSVFSKNIFFFFKFRCHVCQWLDDTTAVIQKITTFRNEECIRYTYILYSNK